MPKSAVQPQLAGVFCKLVSWPPRRHDEDEHRQARADAEHCCARAHCRSTTPACAGQRSSEPQHRGQRDATGSADATAGQLGATTLRAQRGRMREHDRPRQQGEDEQRAVDRRPRLREPSRVRLEPVQRAGRLEPPTQQRAGSTEPTGDDDRGQRRQQPREHLLVRAHAERAFDTVVGLAERRPAPGQLQREHDAGQRDHDHEQARARSATPPRSDRLQDRVIRRGST